MPVILIELVLVLGVTLGIGLWQLYDVNKALKDGETEDGPSKASGDTEAEPDDRPRDGDN